MSTILDAIDEAQDRRKEAEEQGQSPLVVSPRGQSQSNTVDVKLVASSVGEINNNDILIANAASRMIFAYGVSPTLQALRTSTVWLHLLLADLMLHLNMCDFVAQDHNVEILPFNFIHEIITLLTTPQLSKDRVNKILANNRTAAGRATKRK
jgi:hypothetical protein